MANIFSCVLVCGLLVLFSSCGLLTAVNDGELSTVSTKNVTAHYCPSMCTIGNETSCYPPPCPLPPCVDPAKYKPTDCCEYCPNGPNCRGPDGSLIPWNHWEIVHGKNCTCKYIAQNATCI